MSVGQGCQKNFIFAVADIASGRSGLGQTRCQSAASLIFALKFPEAASGVLCFAFSRCFDPLLQHGRTIYDKINIASRNCPPFMRHGEKIDGAVFIALGAWSACRSPRPRTFARPLSPNPLYARFPMPGTSKGGQI